MRIIKYLFYAGFSSAFVLAVFLLSPICAKAMQTGIQISPLIFDYEILPGTSGQGKFTITNLNSEPINYSLDAKDFYALDENGAPVFKSEINDTNKTTLQDWISYDQPTEGSIEANGHLLVNFNILVPSDAEPGGHYSVIYAEQEKLSQDNQPSLGLSSRVGALVLVSVSGDVTKSGEISSFDAPSFVWRGPVDLGMKFKDTGNVHYNSTARVLIKPLLGDAREVDLGTHTILPNSTRAYSGTWNIKYPFGPYRLTVEANDGTGEILNTSKVLWAIPLVIVIPVIILALLIWLIVSRFHKKFRLVKVENESQSNK